MVLLPAGWATSQALAEEVPVPTVPVPTTVAPAPQPPVSVPQPDPAPRPRASPKPAPAPAPRASSQPRVSIRPRVAPRPPARATPAAPVPKPKPKAKAKPEPAATVPQVERPSPRLSRPVVTIEPVRSDDELITTKELLASGIAFLAGLLIPVGLVTAVVLARRRRPRATTEEPVSHQVLTPAPSSTFTQAPATPHPDIVRPESFLVGPPPAFVETEQRPPLAEREQPPPTKREEAPPVTEPMKVAAAEWAGWEFCEIDWWRGYVKSHFFAKATTPGDADYVVRESPMFRWQGNGIPEATPASIAAHEQLLEKLRAEGWEDDPGTPSTWYAQTFRRRQDSGALSR